VIGSPFNLISPLKSLQNARVGNGTDVTELHPAYTTTTENVGYVQTPVLIPKRKSMENHPPNRKQGKILRAVRFTLLFGIC
jgi:hypothetical protein